MLIIINKYTSTIPCPLGCLRGSVGIWGTITWKCPSPGRHANGR